jgi:nicotinic acid mononucleotide adenylyltransferase
MNIGRIRIVPITDVNKNWFNDLASKLSFDFVYAGNPVLKKPLKEHIEIRHLSRADNDYSATKIRRALKKGEGLDYFMPRNAAKLVKEFYEKKA